MNILLIWPSCAESYWSLSYALRFTTMRALSPPLGLLTVASMLPSDWPKKLVDMNVEKLTEEHLEWCDAALVSAIIIQADSVRSIIRQCQRHRVPIIAGGPYFTHYHERIDGVDAFVLGDAEGVMSHLVQDLEKGSLKPLYRADGFPELINTPPPSWDLIDMRLYAAMSVQFSRGCAFDCEFCDVIVLFGRPARFKKPEQVIEELELLYRKGWRGTVVFVDDNFNSGRQRVLELLEVLESWQREKRYPYLFITQVSLNLAQDTRMLAGMAAAGFRKLFVGIESTSDESLKECGKHQNRRSNLLEDVHAMQEKGMEIMGGFIVGFDVDPPTIFDDLFQFVQKAGIPSAMVGLLSALPGTKLWRRLEKQGRLLSETSGNNVMDPEALNFIPKMGRNRLIQGYRSLMRRLYDPQAFYHRVLMHFHHRRSTGVNLDSRFASTAELVSALRIILRVGLLGSARLAFWSFIMQVMARQLGLIPEALRLTGCGYHFWKVARMNLSARSNKCSRRSSRPQLKKYQPPLKARN